MGLLFRAGGPVSDRRASAPFRRLPVRLDADEGERRFGSMSGGGGRVTEHLAASGHFRQWHDPTLAPGRPVVVHRKGSRRADSLSGRVRQAPWIGLSVKRASALEPLADLAIDPPHASGEVHGCLWPEHRADEIEQARLDGEDGRQVERVGVKRVCGQRHIGHWSFLGLCRI